jgi:hypothetical protein
MPPATGPLRDRLVELLSRQAALLEEAPLHLTLLAWVSLGPAEATNDGGSRNSLRARVIENYRQPFDELLVSPQARAELGDFDLTLALAQLLGPLVFGVMTGIRTIDRRDCIRIVDDFFATRGSATTQPRQRAKKLSGRSTNSNTTPSGERRNEM